MTEQQNLNETSEDRVSEQSEEIEEVSAEAKEQEEETVEETSEETVLKELEEKIEETENRYLRLMADFDNFRRRAQLDREASAKYRAQSLISDLLPVIDNFERALKVEATNDQSKSILEGMEMVYKGIIEALKKEGVEIIEAMGKEFDPNLHQAVMTAEDENYDSNIVVEEFQKGYKLKDRVIRPSMVKVNQ
ncbi:molecular chaperone GrpE [Oikeobacillus pervagus]|uniref:Protein GrpE n=1 Tax=Oikeobacillus pervagus TaxID=1325931 RepID=A0AAJ1SWJ5_9BACI|nr:nucleotide exchange factor GrpE [Oikeobacillus pervagus]MDQ0213934.1 molecular chaperone GrpE [Oikeobacillus pervagus]